MSPNYLFNIIEIKLSRNNKIFNANYYSYSGHIDCMKHLRNCKQRLKTARNTRAAAATTTTKPNQNNKT